MDLDKEFKDLDLSQNVEPQKQSSKVVAPIVPEIKTEVKDDTQQLEKVTDFDESDKILADLKQRLEVIQNEEGPVKEEDNNDTVVVVPLWERIAPYIIPICLTIFALVFSGLFLYFFSMSRIQKTLTNISNSGNFEPIVLEAPKPVNIQVIETTPTCNENQVLSEDGKTCVDNTPVATTTPVATKPDFENGTTTAVNIRFSYDKYNYDNSPRGMYLLKNQPFTGEYNNFRFVPTNRPVANDLMFGINRYMVSLMGSCKFTAPGVTVLVRNMNLQNGYFTGKVVKVLNAAKPSIDCAGVQPVEENIGQTVGD